MWCRRREVQVLAGIKNKTSFTCYWINNVVLSFKSSTNACDVV